MVLSSSVVMVVVSLLPEADASEAKASLPAVLSLADPAESVDSLASLVEPVVEFSLVVSVF